MGGGEDGEILMLAQQTCWDGVGPHVGTGAGLVPKVCVCVCFSRGKCTSGLPQAERDSASVGGWRRKWRHGPGIY